MISRAAFKKGVICVIVCRLKHKKPLTKHSPVSHSFPKYPRSLLVKHICHLSWLAKYLECSTSPQPTLPFTNWRLSNKLVPSCRTIYHHIRNLLANFGASFIHTDNNTQTPGFMCKIHPSPPWKNVDFSSKVCFEPGSPGLPGGRNTLSPHFFSITKIRRGKRLHFLTCSNLETPCLPSDRFLSQEQDTFWGLGTQVFTHGAGLFFKAETQLFTEIGFATYVSRGPSRCLSSTFLFSNPNWPLPSLLWPSEFESKQSQIILFFWLEHFSSGTTTSVLAT